MSIMSSRPRQPGRYHMLKANVLVPSAPSATTCTCTVFLGVDVIQALWVNKLSVKVTERKVASTWVSTVKDAFFCWKKGCPDVKPRHVGQNSPLVSTSSLFFDFPHISPLTVCCQLFGVLLTSPFAAKDLLSSSAAALSGSLGLLGLLGFLSLARSMLPPTSTILHIKTTHVSYFNW